MMARELLEKLQEVLGGLGDLEDLPVVFNNSTDDYVIENVMVEDGTLVLEGVG